MTYSAAHMRLYVDGDIVAETTGSGSLDPAGPLRLGRSGDGVSTLDGTLDDLRV